MTKKSDVAFATTNMSSTSAYLLLPHGGVHLCDTPSPDHYHNSHQQQRSSHARNDADSPSGQCAARVWCSVAVDAKAVSTSHMPAIAQHFEGEPQQSLQTKRGLVLDKSKCSTLRWLQNATRFHPGPPWHAACDGDKQNQSSTLQLK
jgi:hypothetical protein